MTFLPRDVEMFKAIGVSQSEAEAAGVRRVTSTEAREVCGVRYNQSQDLAGLAFPYRNPEDGRTVAWRLRRDNPEVEADGSPKAKYLSSSDRRSLYFITGYSSTLADTTVPAIIVEAEKSVLSILAAAGRANRRTPLIVGTGGCWGWRGVVGKATSPSGARVDQKGPLPDFDKVTWTGRDTVVVFDADVTTNPEVQRARAALAAELTRRGAVVRAVTLSIEHGIGGPDDYVGRHGAEAFWSLVDRAPALAPPSPPRAKKGKPPQGHEVEWDLPEPWPSPVVGAPLLDSLAETFERYLALPAHASTALALWVLHTYAFQAAFMTPFLAITSPAKRCGKTLLLIVLGALVPRRLVASNVTGAVLFRAIEKFSPTLLIDEADTFVRDNDELRGVLNSGHTKATAVVIRAVGDDHDPRVFSTWCPKAVALIGKLPGTLEDRSIEIRMRRRTPGEAVERLRQDRIDDQCADVRRQAARWAEDHLETLTASDPDVPTALHDRAADCWRPLLAIADVAGGAWPARARDAAKTLSGAAADDDISTQLLSDIRAIFVTKGNPDVLPSKVIVECLIALDDRPWAEYLHGRPLSQAKLARMLKEYGIFSAGTVRIGDATAKGYRCAAFLEAWERYLGGPEASHRNSANESGPDLAVSNRHTPNECDGLQSVTTPMNTGLGYGVTVSDPVEEDEASRGRF